MAKRKKKSTVPPPKRRAAGKKNPAAWRLSRRELERRRRLAAKKRQIARKKRAAMHAYWERVRQVAREYGVNLQQARQIWRLLDERYERKTPIDAIAEIRNMPPDSKIKFRSPFMQYSGRAGDFDIGQFWKLGSQYFAGELPRSTEGRDDYWKITPIVRAQIKINFKKGIITMYKFEIPVEQDTIFAIFSKEVPR